VADSEALKGFDWLLDEVEKMGGIKLMMTLTNGVNDYGGMQQYVRCADTRAAVVLKGPTCVSVTSTLLFYRHALALRDAEPHM
jgi:endo-1,4-beta-mannosidase